MIDCEKILQFVHLRFRFFFFIILLSLLMSCSVIDVQKSAPLSSSGRWLILPFQNYSQTPRAGEQVEEMLATLLRIRGVPQIEMYQQQDENKNSWPELNDRKRQEDALSLAIKDNASYAVAGSVDEWQYKLGVGSEPAVGLTIRIIEIPSGKVIWSASGARSGWSTESLSGTAQKLLRDLTSSIEVTKL
ncbi:penicillin-binding protein activator LpoB [Nitrosomonas communis]|uniref:penicillin-binding protein activator LpoB n=1 Tax=Nitrosomonas communis TaxID=44574 RepID=UPI0026EA3AD2|nr:penicillin-binding protein activator LpoB [Nitrosomonas communis]MCO6426844.1 penicillin-binding protein activator LpoB [Nitrosomonas communis]